MKKIFLVLMVITMVAGSAFAFDILSYPTSLQGGNIQVDIGLGYSGWGSYSGWKMKIPPLVASVEYCLPVAVPISVGGMFAISQYGWDFYSNHSATYTYLTFAARGNWHWGFEIDWLDLYTGLGIGYQHFTQKWEGPNAAYYEKWYNYNYGGLYWGTQVGAHFYFIPMVGVVVEFGYPIYAKAALALKF